MLRTIKRWFNMGERIFPIGNIEVIINDTKLINKTLFLFIGDRQFVVYDLKNNRGATVGEFIIYDNKSDFKILNRYYKQALKRY